MRAFEEVVRHWQLTVDEERAVCAAIRGYLDAVPTDEATVSLLHGVLGETDRKRSAPALAECPATRAVRVPEGGALPGAGLPPEKIDQSQLPADAQARLAAEAAKMSMWNSVPLAKHEGADT